MAGSLPTNDFSSHRKICFSCIMQYLMWNTKPLGKQLQNSDNHKNRMLKYLQDSTNLLT